jgi:putative flippase GtrA
MEREFNKYIRIGIINTLCTYVLSGIIYSNLESIVGFITAGILSSLICIKFSFWTQRLYVFESRGIWYYEYLKSNIGYAGTTLISIAIMYFLVKVLNVNIWLSQALTMPIVILSSYYINKNYTFKKIK